MSQNNNNFSNSLNRQNSGPSQLKIAAIIMLFVLLLFILIISITSFWLRIKKSNVIDGISYTRGSHIFNATGTDDSSKDINMECEPGKVICIELATQICTGSSSDNSANKNYENPSTDPISSGIKNGDGSDDIIVSKNYGIFNDETTVNLKDFYEKKCGGEEKCKHKYELHPFPNDMTCNEKTQFISTYTCIPVGTKCI
jgi:hypothetical protein